MSFDEEGRIITNLTFKLLPDDDGIVFRQSIDGEPVLQLTTNGFVIENWEKFMESADNYSMIRLGKNSNFTLTEAISSEAFSKFTDRLADGEFPAGTSFVIRIIYPKGEEVKRKMEAIAFLPDNTKEDLTGLTEFFTELTNRGVILKVSSSGFSIDLPALQRCPECGQKFTAKKSNQIYHDTRCGTKARMREWRRKKAAEKEQSL